MVIKILNKREANNLLSYSREARIWLNGFVKRTRKKAETLRIDLKK